MINKRYHKYIIILAIGLIVTAVLYKYNTREIVKGTLPIYENTVENSDNTNDGFIVLVNSNIVIKDGTANILAQNSEYNVDNCVVKIYNGDNLLYESDTLYPGFYIENAKLFNSDIDTTKESRVVFEILDNNDKVKSTTTINVDITE